MHLSSLFVSRRAFVQNGLCNEIIFQKKAIINVLFVFLRGLFRRSAELFVLWLRHYSLEVKNPYCCIVHNLPKLAFFVFSFFSAGEMNKTWYGLVKYWQLQQYVIKYDYRERNTTKNVLLLTPFMAFLLTFCLSTGFSSTRLREPRQKRNGKNCPKNGISLLFDCFFSAAAFPLHEASIKNRA